MTPHLRPDLAAIQLAKEGVFPAHSLGLEVWAVVFAGRLWATFLNETIARQRFDALVARRARDASTTRGAP